MKNILLMTGLLLAYSSFADIEYEGPSSKPTQAEMQKNRACFEELKVHGCGDPGEDPVQFRICMSSAYSQLSQDCQKLMSKLYR
jgi:hypothetical protein